MTDLAAQFAAETAGVGLEKLEGKTRQGDFVHRGQTMGDKEGFGKVSKIWLDQTLTWDQTFEKLAQDKAKSHDIKATVKEFVPQVENGKFGFTYKDQFFVPTEHALNQLAVKCDIGTWYANSLRENPLKPGKDDEYKYYRDERDAQTLALVMANGLRRLDQSKTFFFRTREDGTMRAFLTDRFAVVDNVWLLETIKGIIPDARFSHWRGDADTLFGNVLIPDSLRADTDSDYGGMLSIGNSEIGERRVSSVPSVFRAICMNGCIWDQEKGKGISQVHRGKINLPNLAIEIQTNLNAQIPLLDTCIDMLLKTRESRWDKTEVSIRPVIAQLALDNKFDRKQANQVLDAWNVERETETAFSLFGLTNAVTRAAQEQEKNGDWVAFDTLGGNLVRGGDAGLKKIISRAKGLDVEEVDEVFTKPKKGKLVAA